MRCALIVRDVLQFERVSFGDMWMRMENLFLQTWINRKKLKARGNFIASYASLYLLLFVG